MINLEDQDGLLKHNRDNIIQIAINFYRELYRNRNKENSRYLNKEEEEGQEEDVLSEISKWEVEQ